MYNEPDVDKGPGGPIPLGRAIRGLHRELFTMQSQLRAAHQEIDRLRLELIGRDTSAPEIPDVDLTALRRRVAFFCHPDRGGDARLMCKLNVLFDYLAAQQAWCEDK